MYRPRANYWSNGPLAKALTKRFLGKTPPVAETSKGWRVWHAEFKAGAPITEFLVEEVFDQAQNVVYFPLDVYKNVKTYLQNRFGDKLQYLRTGTKPGEYHDLDYRLIHSCFNALVDFVEVEKAGCVGWNEELRGKWDGKWSRLNKWNLLETERCAGAGIDYLNWEITLREDGRPTHQARNALVIKELYLWWTEQRPKRVDPHARLEIVPIEDIWDLDTPLSDDVRDEFERGRKLEEMYDREDTEKLCELMRIRQSLWT